MTLKNKYNLFYFIFCIVGCCMAGFVAVFLQFKGISNTMIGVVTGIGCVSSIVLSPCLSSLIIKYEKLTARNMLAGIYSLLAVMFAVIAFVPLPPAAVVAGYSVMYALYVGSASFPQVIASDYMQEGRDINFGLARGLGSASWAITALVMGPAIDFFNPLVLAAGFIASTGCMLLLIRSMPRAETAQTGKDTGKSTVLSIIKNYPIYFMVLTGYSFCLGAHSCLGTYLPGIVSRLGGSTGVYGVAVFLMALSEMPVMAMAAKWMKKTDSLTLIAIGGFAYVIRNFTICMAPNIAMVIAGLLFQSVSYGLLTAVITYYVIYNLAPGDQVMGQAMIGIMSSGFGSTAGNIVGGMLLDNIGMEAMFVFACTMTVIGCAVIAAAKITDRKRKKAVI